GHTVNPVGCPNPHSHRYRCETRVHAHWRHGGVFQFCGSLPQHLACICGQPALHQPWTGAQVPGTCGSGVGRSGADSHIFTVVMDRYLTPEFRHGFLFAVHNKYLLVLSETGAVGLLSFLAFLLDALRNGWQCWARQDRLLSPLALGFAAGIAGHMVHMSVDVFRGRPTQQLLWLIAGLLTAMLRVCKPRP